MQKLLTAALVITVLIWVVSQLWLAQTTQTTPVVDTTATAFLGGIESVVTAQGTLEPKDYVDVGAQVSGLINKLHISIGDIIKEGDLIAEIDPDVYTAQVRGDNARLKTLKAQKSEQQALVIQAKNKFERNQRLFKSKAVSKEALEDAETTFNIAQSQIISLDAQIEEAQSTLEGNQTNLSYTKIYAPMDGTVVDQSVKEGQTINANQSAPEVVQIANLDIMTAKAQVAEADIMRLNVDMPVYFTTLGSQDRRWEGRIRQILPTPETINDVVLYNVLVDVDNTDHNLMTGMTTQMFFILAKEDNVAVIHKVALGRRLYDQDTKQGKAYLVTLANKAKETKPVIIGITDRTKAIIIEGLKIGDVVVLPNVNATTNSSKKQPGPPPGMGRL